MMFFKVLFMEEYWNHAISKIICYLANLDKPKPGYIKSHDNILFGFGLSKLGSIAATNGYVIALNDSVFNKTIIQPK